MKIKTNTVTHPFWNKVKMGTKNRFDRKIKDNTHDKNVIDIIKHLAFDPYTYIPVEERCKECKKFESEHQKPCEG